MRAIVAPVAQQGSDLAHRTPGFVESTPHDVAAFRSWSAAELRDAVALLAGAAARQAAGTMSAARCGELEMVLGMHHNPHGLLASTALMAHVDPISACTYDWVHNMLQDRNRHGTDELILLTCCAPPAGLKPEARQK